MAKTVIEEFVAVFGIETNDKSVKDFSSSLKELKDFLIKSVKYASGTAAAMIGYSIAANKATAANEAFAKSIGMNGDTLTALDESFSAFGFNYRKIVEMMKSFSARIGEKKGIGELAVADKALKMLKLDLKEIKDLSPEDQFFKIYEEAQKLGDVQIGMSAISLLFGDDAGKLLSYLVNTNQNLLEMVNRKKQLILMGDEDKANAERSAVSWGSLLFILKQVGSYVASVLGNVIVEVTKDLEDYVIANKDLIKTNLAKFVKGFVNGLIDIIKALKAIGGVVFNVMNVFNGLSGTARTLFTFFLGQKIFGVIRSFGALRDRILESDKGITKFKASMRALKGVGKSLLAGLGLTALDLIIEDLISGLTGGKSAIFRFIDELHQKLKLDELLWDLALKITQTGISLKLNFGKTFDWLQNHILDGFAYTVFKLKNIMRDSLAGIGVAFDDLIGRDFRDALDRTFSIDTIAGIGNSFNKMFGNAFRKAMDVVIGDESIPQAMFRMFEKGLVNLVNHISSSIKTAFVNIVDSIFNTIRGWFQKLSLSNLIPGVRDVMNVNKGFNTPQFQGIQNTTSSNVSSNKVVNAPVNISIDTRGKEMFDPTRLADEISTKVSNSIYNAVDAINTGIER